MRTLILAAAAALALTACSGGDDAPRTDAAPQAAVEAAATAPSDAAMAPSDGPAPTPSGSVTPGNPDGTYPPGQTPPVLPTEPATTSPATSPPPQ